MNNNKNIPNIDGLINNNLLLHYVQGNVTNEEKLLVENAMQQSSFIKESVEGLSLYKNTTTINTSVFEVNKHLQQLVTQKPKKQFIQQTNYITIITFSVIVLLLVAVSGYCIFRLMH